MSTRPKPLSKEEWNYRKKNKKNKKREKYSLAILTAAIGSSYSDRMGDILVEISVNMADILINELDKRK